MSDSLVTATRTSRVEDRLDIRDLFTRYGHAIFMIDEAELRQVFATDAIIDTGAGDRGIDDYAPDVIRRHTPVVGASLQVTNVLIDFLGPDEAFTESWGLETQHRPDPETGEMTDFVYWVRYGDVLRRDTQGAWRIARRRLVIDHAMALPARETTVSAFLEGRFVGKRGPDDPVATFRRSVQAGS